jgi:3-hydroxy-3-methylglutaryl CoA synthase
MAGIVSYGAYIPPTRLGFSVIAGGAPKEGAPERSVAWNDEDAVTMGVSAAVNSLRGFDRGSIDGVLFASTTYPFKEKQGAALVAKALDLRRDVRTADLSGSLRAGTDALRAAFDSVAAGSAKRVLVIASDVRLGAPGSGLERNFGDGAAAFIIGDTDTIADEQGSFAFAEEVVDVWRTEGDAFVHTWEERFVVQQGYTPGIVEAVEGLFSKLETDAAAFNHVALYAPDARSHGGAARALKIEPSVLVAPLFGQLGNAGVAFAPLLLVAALEAARPGERILLANYGDGGEAAAFSVGAHIEKLEPRRGLAFHLGRRRAVASYDKYLKARNLDSTEYDAGTNQGLSATIHFREREDEIAFKAQKCGACGALQFPAQRVCESCYAKDDFEFVRLSDKIGAVVTFTFDFFFPTPDPPTIVSITDIDGARVHLQLVNITAEEVRPGMPVEFEFRRIHQVGGRPNYYWKGVPRAE